MDLAKATFAEALNAVAARALLARTKQADAVEAANQAQAARQTLGILGANPESVNSAIDGLRSGRMGPTRAYAGVRAAVPITPLQLGRVPEGVAAAAQAGRPDEMLNQADVLGLKNAIPGSGHFSPLATTAAGAAGAGAAGLGFQARRVARLRDTLHGGSPEAVKAMQDTLRPDTFRAWDLWRRNPANTPTPPKSVGSLLRQTFQAPKDMPIGGITQIGDRQVYQPHTLHAAQLGQAARKVPLAGPGGRLARFGVPAAAAALPLLLREWMPGGYRSGAPAARQLVDANRELAKEPK